MVSLYSVGSKVGEGAPQDVGCWYPNSDCWKQGWSGEEQARLCGRRGKVGFFLFWNLPFSPPPPLSFFPALLPFFGFPQERRRSEGNLDFFPFLFSFSSRYAKTVNATYMETSAKLNRNVETVFLELAKSEPISSSCCLMWLFSWQNSFFFFVMCRHASSCKGRRWRDSSKTKGKEGADHWGWRWGENRWWKVLLRICKRK